RDTAGLDRLDLRETRKPAPFPERGDARGGYRTTARTVAHGPSRGSISTSSLLGRIRGLRRRRQGDQARETAAEAVARPAGRHPGSAGFGRLELADWHGGRDGRSPRWRGRRGSPHRRAAAADGRGSRRQTVV